MRETNILIIAQIVLLCLLFSAANAEMSSTSFRISTTVMSSGGNTMSSTNFRMVSTFGQPTVLGNGSSASYSSYPGFLYTLLLSKVGDVNGDGLINLKDVIAALQVVTGQSLDSIMKEADVNGDGKIGLSEALFILRLLGH
jgi:hypothetical protein